VHAHDFLPVVGIHAGITSTPTGSAVCSGTAIIAVLALARAGEVERVRDMERMGAGSAEQLYP
jgi:hypothetical protein